MGILSNGVKEVGESPMPKKKKNAIKKILIQFETEGNNFYPSGKIDLVSRMPAGVFEITMSPARGVYFKQKHVNTDSLLRFPDTKSDEVVNEIEHFWTLKEKFEEYGYLHKRGFLLHGPPGSGKTSILSIVSQKMVEKDGIVLISNNPGLTSSGLQMLREIEPERTIVVIMEDMDTLINSHGENTILSLLDGENSVGGVVYVATTNYPERLPERIIDRPSRFDRVVEIGFPSPAAREMYLASRGVKEDMPKWVALTDGFSIAHMKELIVGVCCFGQKIEDVANRLAGMAKKVKNTSRKFKLPQLTTALVDPEPSDFLDLDRDREGALYWSTPVGPSDSNDPRDNWQDQPEQEGKGHD